MSFKKHLSRSLDRQRIVRLSWSAILVIMLAGCSGLSGGGQSQPSPQAAGITSASPTQTGVSTIGVLTPTLPPDEPAQTAVPLAETGSTPTATAVDCTPPASPTGSMTEGPYYTPGTPERTSLLEPGIAGERLVLTGYVLNTSCQPVPGAWLDFWQADGNGAYDNSGYRLRGHQYTDEQGRYSLETVVPGLYPGRTAHIHVKVQAPGGEVLTTQLFLPDEPGNQRDRIFSPDLVMEIVQKDDSETQAAYNFILKTR